MDVGPGSRFSGAAVYSRAALETAAVTTKARQPDFSFYDSTRYRLALSLLIGPFMVLFLLVFQPFGVNNYDPDQRISADFLTTIAMIGLALSGASLFNEFALRPLLFRRASTIRIVAWSAWTCLLLSQVAFLLYNLAGDWHDWRLGSALQFVVDCSAVFIFPLVGTFLWFRSHDLSARLERTISRVNARTRPETLLTFQGQGTGDHLRIRSRDFLFARAQDNYVEIHYLQGEQPRQLLIRATLAGISEQVDAPHAVRCHRSYLVNLNAVVSVRGPRNALRLRLRRVEEPIPVSRSFSTELESHLDAAE